MFKKSIFFLFVTLSPLHANQACINAPTIACLYDLASDAAKKEAEGWATTGLYETLLQTDPNLTRRAEWLKKYEAVIAESKIEGLRERLPAIKAEYYARINNFTEAYSVLGLLSEKADPTAEPSLLIIDEARAGQLKEAFSRVEKMVEEDSQDDTYSELLNIAIEKDLSFAPQVFAKIKDVYIKRLGESTLLGAKGDFDAFKKKQIEWVNASKEGNDYPFDAKDNALRETYDVYLLGAIFANNFESYKKALQARGAMKESDDADSLGKLSRPLIRGNRTEWLSLLAANAQLPEGEMVAAEEDAFRLKGLTKEQLLANLTAVESAPSLKTPILDQIIDLLLQRGESSEAVKLFIEKGRLDKLNAVKYDEDKVSALFEALYRHAYAKKLPELALLKSKVTNEGAKEFFNKIEGFGAKISLAEKAPLAEEPSEEEWAIVMDMLFLEGNFVKAAKVITNIKSEGLKASAFTQLMRSLFDKGL